MPEGDSVYRVARRLDAALAGRTPRRTDFRVPRHATADLSGRQVLGTATHGKHLRSASSGDTRRGEEHWVAGRAGQPCRRCGTPAQVAAAVALDPERRRTWWCPHCQPGPVRPATA